MNKKIILFLFFAMLFNFVLNAQKNENNNYQLYFGLQYNLNKGYSQPGIDVTNPLYLGKYYDSKIAPHLGIIKSYQIKCLQLAVGIEYYNRKFVMHYDTGSVRKYMQSSYYYSFFWSLDNPAFFYNYSYNSVRIPLFIGIQLGILSVSTFVKFNLIDLQFARYILLDNSTINKFNVIPRFRMFPGLRLSCLISNKRNISFYSGLELRQDSNIDIQCGLVFLL